MGSLNGRSKKGTIGCQVTAIRMKFVCFTFLVLLLGTTRSTIPSFSVRILVYTVGAKGNLRSRASTKDKRRFHLLSKFEVAHVIILTRHQVDKPNSRSPIFVATSSSVELCKIGIEHAEYPTNRLKLSHPSRRDYDYTVQLAHT
jgi:hypothetical protein